MKDGKRDIKGRFIKGERYRNFGTPEEYFWNHVIKGNNEEDCWGWKAGKNRKGYGITRGKNGSIGAHRFSYELHYCCEIPKGLLVLHSCDNPKCTNPKHLRVGTYKENSRDMVLRKRSTLGRPCKTSKLTKEQVIELRILYANNILTQRQISILCGVSEGTVSTIINRKVWKNI